MDESAAARMAPQYAAMQASQSAPAALATQDNRENHGPDRAGEGDFDQDDSGEGEQLGTQAIPGSYGSFLSWRYLFLAELLRLDATGAGDGMDAGFVGTLSGPHSRNYRHR
jgi:hypothetical protein